MKRLTPSLRRGMFSVAAVVLLGAVIMATGPVSLRTAAADPPENQEYTGVKRCASCHFEQYATWKKSPHAKAFDILTAKYQKDQKCLKCHTTGLGEPTGYVNQAKTAALASVTCESCHGPGSEHEVISQKYANVKTLTPAQEEEVRGSIWLMLPKNVCVECHAVQAHKESQTPKELRKK